MNALRTANNLVLLLLLGFSGCGGKSALEITDALSAVLESDLSAMASDVGRRDPGAVLERPYSRVTQYLFTPNSRQYTHKAVADFFYFDSVRMKQIRKYRYKPSLGLWERYDKQLVYNLSGGGS